MRYNPLHLSIRQRTWVNFKDLVSFHFVYLRFLSSTLFAANETRDHVFHIKFPSTWRSSDIQEIFKNYGQVYINWVNNSAAFVSLQNRENSSVVIKTIQRPGGFSILTLKQYMELNNVQKTPERSSKKRPLESDTSHEVGWVSFILL